MRFLFAIIAFLFNLSLFAQPSAEAWEAEEKSNFLLLPRYGYIHKTEAQVEADSAFVRQIMLQPQFKTRRESSNHLIDLGFKYFYRTDFKTAMYRFNQAYLLDTTNADIFWGYGAIYMAFGRYELAKKQYETGLAIDTSNTHLLTDLATYYMQGHYVMDQMPKNDVIKDPKEKAGRLMDTAIYYLKKSYSLDSRDVNTTYKLSICYWNIKDCPNAWKYYDAAKALGGAPITKEFTEDLEARCKRN